MRRLVLSIVAAGAVASATLSAAPADAGPISNAGALAAAAASLDNVHEAALVCGRWRCWRSWGPGYRTWGYGAWGPAYGAWGPGYYGAWRRPAWGGWYRRGWGRWR